MNFISKYTVILLACLVATSKADGQAAFKGTWVGEINITNETGTFKGYATIGCGTFLQTSTPNEVAIELSRFTNGAARTYDGSAVGSFSQANGFPTVSFNSKCPIDNSYHTCKGTYSFVKKTSNGQPYLSGTFKSSDPECSKMTVSVVLFEKSYVKKLTKNGDFYVLPSIEPASPTTAPGPAQNARPKYALERAGTYKGVDLGFVTHHDEPGFKWVDWSKASTGVRAVAEQAKASGSKTVAQEIAEMMAKGCAVRVAITDLDENGTLGIAVRSKGDQCCARSGCFFNFFENGGALTLDLMDDGEPRPAPNGVASSVGLIMPLTARRN